MNTTDCRVDAGVRFAWQGVLLALFLSVVSGLSSVGCRKPVTPPDTTPPDNVANFSATAGDRQVALTWTLPSDARFSGVRIQRKIGSAPASPSDGITAYEGTGASLTDTGLENGKTCHYAAFSYNANRNYSSGVHTSATPTSASAHADILTRIADTMDSVSTVPDSVFDAATKTALEEDLAQVDGLYRAGDVCGSADAVKEYLAELQRARHDAGKPLAEILYNWGRMLRYDMLGTVSAKEACPDAERIGQEAAADLDPQVSNLEQVEANFRFGEPELATASGNGEIFTTVNLPGISTSTDEEGLPSIPVMTRLFAVPDDAIVETTVAIEEAEQIQLNVFPTQTPGIAESHPEGVVRDTAPPPFVKDEGFYAQDRLYPESTAALTELGRVRGLRVVRLDIPAGQYNPAANALRLFRSGTVRLSFTGGRGQYGTYDPSNLFEPLQPARNELLLNADLLGSLKQIPFTGSEEGAELLIVTHSKFLDAANRLAEFKTSTGVVTNVVKVGALALPTSADIRNLILTYRENSQIKFSYVLLIGDVGYIAPFYFPEKGTGSDGEASPPCDFGYSTTTDPATRSWSDWVVGRISVNETAEADAAVNKLINYEQNPTNSADFYRHIALCTAFQCCQPPIYGIGPLITFDPPLLQGVEQQPFTLPLERAKAVLEVNGFNVQRIYTEKIDGGDPDEDRPAYTADPAPRYFCDGAVLPADIGSNPSGVTYPAEMTADLVDAWDEGRIFVFYNSHGWCNGPGWWATPFGYWHAGGLAQDKPLPVVFSTTCDSGFYDLEINASCDPDTTDPCFAEALVRYDRRGAAALIAAPRETLISVNGHLTEGYAHAITHLGDAVKMRLADVFWYGQGWLTGSCSDDRARSHNHLYHIFGDPSLRIRMRRPPLSLSYSGMRAVLQSAGHLEVHYPTEGATITAYRDLREKKVPVGRGVVRNGVAEMQMLTTRYAQSVNVETPLELVVSHPDALSITLSTPVEPPE